MLATLRDEREILDSVCASDAARAPLFAQIAATTAWALVLEAGLAVRLNASCPAAAKALPTMMLSDAWLALAKVVNDSGGTVPPIFADVIPKVQTGAQAVGLTLPAWARHLGLLARSGAREGEDVRRRPARRRAPHPAS